MSSVDIVANTAESIMILGGFGLVFYGNMAGSGLLMGVGVLCLVLGFLALIFGRGG